MSTDAVPNVPSAPDALHHTLRVLIVDALMAFRWAEAPAAMFQTDADGQIVASNALARALWGGAAAPVWRTWIMRDSHGVAIGAERSWIAQVRQEQRSISHYACSIEFLPGLRRDVVAYARPISALSDAPSGALHLLLDITEHKDVERRHRALTQRWAEVGKQARAAAHDFNNLLTTILANLQLAEMDIPEEQPGGECLKEAIAATRRAREAVGRLLALRPPGAPDGS